MKKFKPLTWEKEPILSKDLLHNLSSKDLPQEFSKLVDENFDELIGEEPKKETLEEVEGNDKKIEDYYLGKTLKLKRSLPSRYYETTLQESETIKIDKFVEGDVEGCRVAIGYKDGFEFLLFNTTHAESYLQGLYSLIDEPTITQEESLKMEKLELLPCPFCGGKAEIKQTGKLKLKLKCKSCLIGIEQKTLRFSLDWLEGKMIEGWNKRI